MDKATEAKQAWNREQAERLLVDVRGAIAAGTLLAKDVRKAVRAEVARMKEGK